MAQKRRKFTAQFKFETVMEVLRGEKSVAQLCRERDITETLYYNVSSKCDESELLAAPLPLLLRFPFYSYRKLSRHCSDAGLPQGSKSRGDCCANWA
jgi:hypothetical protein